MRKTSALALLAIALLGLSACESRTDKVDGGGVLLSISDFDGLPIRIFVNTSGSIVQVGEFVIQNVIKDPTGISSDLMNVEIQSYEVRYTRADSGTRVPNTLVNGLFGVAPAGGTATFENIPVMLAEQFQNPPISDLFFQNGGFDKETGEAVIVLNLTIRFFGRTLSGDAVQTAPSTFSVEFIP